MQTSRLQQHAISLVLLPVFILWQINGIYLAAIARISIPLFWLADFMQWIILPAALLLFLAKKRALFPEHYGLSLAELRWQQLSLQSLAVFFTTALIYHATLKLAGYLFEHPVGFFSFPEVFPGGLMGTFIWFYSAVTAGMIESIFFISLPWLLYQSVKHEPSRLMFTLLVSVIFAVAHWEQGPHNIIAAFCFNLAACAWYFRLGTLWPVVVGHTLIDLIEFA